MNKYFISTAIAYTNADPHLGFAMELIQADTLARYQRLLEKDVFFVTGTDENALKNVQAAEKAGIGTKEFVDKHAQKFKNLAQILNISNNDFIRTTEARHIKGAQKLWKACKPEDIYKKGYKGLYCVGCEEFKTPKDLVEGVCPEHKIKPEEVEEENYFFRLSKYERELTRVIESGELKITPDSRKNEILEFIKGGLEDFSISRSRTRAKNWGISVPGDDSQIMYVWFDALTNYVNALGYGTDDARFDEYWRGGYVSHLVGKGITRFHAIYWPAMLMSASLPLPREIIVHGYVTADGEKMSKSLGNIVDPFRIAEKYGTDVVRYFLLREIPSGEDGDFSEKKLVERYNGELANGLGNLVSRVAKLIETGLDGELIYDSNKQPASLGLRRSEQSRSDRQEDYNKAIGEFRLHDALGEIWKLIAEANQYVDDRKPWIEVKENPSNFLETMNVLVGQLHGIAYLLRPFMPETAQKIAEVFGDDLDNKDIPDNFKFFTAKKEALFPRLK